MDAGQVAAARRGRGVEGVSGVLVHYGSPPVADDHVIVASSGAVSFRDKGLP